jgi:hypothetical protein
MYRQHNIVAHLHNHCCYGNETICSLCSDVELYVYVAVNNITLFSVTMELQERVPFTLLSSYKIFHTDANNTNILRS